MIRLVATDLDGTFWNAKMAVPAAHIAAVRELNSRGITVLAATSRRARVVRAALGTADLSLPAVLLDGAIGIDFRVEQRFHDAPFEPTVAAATLAAFRAVGLDPCLYVDKPDVDLAISDQPSTCSAHLSYIRDVARVEDLEAAVQTGLVYGFSVLGLPWERLEPVSRALAGYGVQAQLYPEPEYGDFGLIVSAPGVSKWSGIEAYCQVAGIRHEEVLAVGDADNDIPMLLRAAVAVAVTGGTNRAIEVADHVIARPDEQGWASLPDLIG